MKFRIVLIVLVLSIEMISCSRADCNLQAGSVGAGSYCEVSNGQ